MKIGRNEPCPCGSGRKYKRCCLSSPPVPPREVVERLMRESQKPRPEPHLHLVESIVFKGQRIRAFNNTVHTRPPNETFHEFLVNVVAWTFGETWWRQQFGMPVGQRHVVIDWRYAFSSMTNGDFEARVETAHGEQFITTPSGPAKALVAFGYDLWCAQTSKRLPESVVDRLRRHSSFQGARYEIAAAAIMARAGFSLEFLDDVEVSTKHCEFIASHKATQERVAVEAKSRVRPGAMNERGVFAYDGDRRGLVRLARDACKQGRDGLPLAVFLDVNVPPTPAVAPAERQWVRDVRQAAADLERAARNRGDDGEPYSALVATNFGFHFEPDDGKASPPEGALVLPKSPQVPLAPALVQSIGRSVAAYGEVPQEV